jgi:hypothetical protein
MAITDGLILDPTGQPIKDKLLKEEATKKLEEYVHKYHSRFADWFRQYGQSTRPPIFYDMKAKEWIWIED